MKAILTLYDDSGKKIKKVAMDLEPRPEAMKHFRLKSKEMSQHEATVYCTPFPVATMVAREELAEEIKQAIIKSLGSGDVVVERPKY